MAKKSRQKFNPNKTCFLKVVFSAGSQIDLPLIFQEELIQY